MHDTSSHHVIVYRTVDTPTTKQFTIFVASLDCAKKDKKYLENKEYLEAFNKLKELITNAPVLAYPDFSKPFVIASDASNVGVRAELSQDKHLVSCYSRTLNSAEQNYSTIEKDCWRL